MTRRVLLKLSAFIPFLTLVRSDGQVTLRNLKLSNTKEDLDLLKVAYGMNSSYLGQYNSDPHHYSLRVDQHKATHIVRNVQVRGDYIYGDVTFFKQDYWDKVRNSQWKFSYKCVYTFGICTEIVGWDLVDFTAKTRSKYWASRKIVYAI